MYMIALSEGQFHRQPWVNPDRTTVPNEEIAPSPISGYRGGLFLGEDSWAFIRPEVRSSAGGCGCAGCGTCGRRRRGRSGLWRRVSEGVIVVIRGLGEGWVDRRVRQRRSELVYWLRGNNSFFNGVSELAISRRWGRLTWWLFTAVGLGVGTTCTETAFQATLEQQLFEIRVRKMEENCKPDKVEPRYTSSCQRGTSHRLSSQMVPLHTRESWKIRLSSEGEETRKNGLFLPPAEALSCCWFGWPFCCWGV